MASSSSSATSSSNNGLNLLSQAGEYNRTIQSAIEQMGERLNGRFTAVAEHVTQLERKVDQLSQRIQSQPAAQTGLQMTFPNPARIITPQPQQQGVQSQPARQFVPSGAFPNPGRPIAQQSQTQRTPILPGSAEHCLQRASQTNIPADKEKFAREGLAKAQHPEVKAKLYHQLAIALDKQRKLSETEEALKLGIALNTSIHIILRKGLKRVFRNQNKFQEAEKVVRDLIEIESNKLTEVADHYVDLVNLLYLQKKNFEEIEVKMRFALSIKTTDLARKSIMHSALAYSLVEQDRDVEGEDEARKGLAIASGQPNVNQYKILLKTLVKQNKNPDEVERLARKPLENKDLKLTQNQKVELYDFLTWALIAQGKSPTDVEKVAKSGLACVTPTSDLEVVASLHKSLAMSLREQDKYGETEVAIKAALSLNLTDPNVKASLYEMLAVTLLDQKKDPAEIEQVVRAGLVLSPTDGEILFYLRLNLASALVAQGKDFDLVEQIAREELKANYAPTYNDQADLYYFLALSLFKQNKNLEEALDAARKGIKCRSTVPLRNTELVDLKETLKKQRNGIKRKDAPEGERTDQRKKAKAISSDSEIT